MNDPLYPQGKPGKDRWLIPLLAGTNALVLLLGIVVVITRAGDGPSPRAGGTSPSSDTSYVIVSRATATAFGSSRTGTTIERFDHRTGRLHSVRAGEGQRLETISEGGRIYVNLERTLDDGTRWLAGPSTIFSTDTVFSTIGPSLFSVNELAAEGSLRFGAPTRFLGEEMRRFTMEPDLDRMLAAAREELRAYVPEDLWDEADVYITEFTSQIPDTLSGVADDTGTIRRLAVELRRHPRGHTGPLVRRTGRDPPATCGRGPGGNRHLRRVHRHLARV